MIIINKAQTNDVILTLEEKRTLDSPTFLFRFTNDQLKTSKIFIAADLSEYVRRYNKFSIEETSSEDLTDGKVELEEGFYVYEIYEQNSTTNLDINQVDNLIPLQVGRVRVIGTRTAVPEYDQQDKEFIAYG